MKFLFDENMSPAVLPPVKVLFRSHEFVSLLQHDAGAWRGVDDKQLIDELAISDFDVLVTQDRNQLTAHRDELLGSGLHWIGLKSPRVSNLKGLASSAACLLASLPHVLEVLDEWTGSNGCWMNLTGLPGERTQRVRVLNRPVTHAHARVTRLKSS